MKGKLWTPDRTNTLRRMWNRHETWEIAKTLGVTACAVRAKASKLGLSAPRGTPVTHVVVSESLLAEQVRRLKAEIPPDTRDLTARMFGDPIPGRRAIDKRMEA